MVADVNVSDIDINQCDSDDVMVNSSDGIGKTQPGETATTLRTGKGQTHLDLQGQLQLSGLSSMATATNGTRLRSSTSFHIAAFKGTHKCHQPSSLCYFVPGKSWHRGSYTCQCKPGFYSNTGTSFNGSLVEGTTNDTITRIKKKLPT